MPGITGIIRKGRFDEATRDVRLMVKVMQHEQFYAAREYANESLGLNVAWTSHQKAAVECLPIISRDRNLVFIFQGENYLDQETAAELKRSGTAWENSGLGYLLEQCGGDENKLLRRLNGWFCGVLVDLRQNKVTLFNDRFGMNRIYFYEGKDEFLFSSEAKSLLKIRPELRRINPASLAQYLRANCVMANKSLFEKIDLLPQAACWTFENGALSQKRRYFDFKEWESLPKLDSNQFNPLFTETVSAAFPRYAESPEKVAMSLTAGLDTRVIMAALGSNSRSLPCYTFGGTWGETFDISTARKVANLFGHPHEAIRINEAFFKKFGEYARRTIYITDGTHDAFGAHDLYFNQVARQIAPIRLTGKFGSEVVRIRRMIPWVDFNRELFRPEFRTILENSSPLSKVTETGDILTRAVAEEIPWFEYGRVIIEQSQVVLRTPYMDNDLLKLMYQAPVELRAAARLQAMYVKEKSPALAEILTNLSKSGNHSRLVSSLIYYWFWSMFKAEYIYLFATPHWATRIDNMLRGLKLERLLAGRQKFEAYRIWMTLYMGDFIRETLLSPQAQYTQFFEKDVAEKMVKRHLAGTHNYLDEINKLLTVELMCSTLLGDQN
jgi:asparagine synthase (glutamine-hydrolysing)